MTHTHSAEREEIFLLNISQLPKHGLLLSLLRNVYNSWDLLFWASVCIFSGNNQGGEEGSLFLASPEGFPLEHGLKC